MDNQSHSHDAPSAEVSQKGVDNGKFYSEAFLERRRRAIEEIDQASGFQGVDEFDRKLPAGHARAVRTSSRLTSDLRRQYRKGAVDITPQDVIDVLTTAGVKN